MLQRFRAFLELEFRFVASNKDSDAYKAELLDNLMARADDMAKSGEQDEDKIYNTCIEQLGDFRETLATYKKTINPKYQANRALNVLIVSLIYSLLVVGAYLATSFTKAMPWSTSWIILTSGFLGGLVICSVHAFVVLVAKKKYVPARFFIHTAIVLSTVITYLCYSVLTANVWGSSWLIFLIMIILSTGVECIYDFLTDSKLATLSIMVFIPVSFSIVYVMLGLSKMLPWHPYWFIPSIAVAFDIILSLVLLKKKLK